MELLATAHVNKRGIYLWSNQLLFGNSGGIQPSTEVVHVRPASIASGRPFVDARDEAGRLPGTRDWDSDEDAFEDSSDDDAASVVTYVAADDEEAEAEGAQAVYEERDACNVPTPLQDGLVTLSGDPLSKWDALVHLDAIKARNKPEEAPKKPESAPFFLPTMEAQEMRMLGDAARDALATAAGVQTASEGAGEAAAAAASQVKRVSAPTQQRIAQSPLLRLLVEDLRGGGDFSGALRWLQGASPVLVERELACVDAVPPCELDDVEAVEAMLGYVSHQLETQKNFDHAVGVLALVLQLHGQAIPQHKQLHESSATIREHLGQAWQKVDVSVQSLHCLVQLFGHMQA
eukprot:jgi/Ulvmu1/5229/UM022_0022.1